MVKCNGIYHKLMQRRFKIDHDSMLKWTTYTAMSIMLNYTGQVQLLYTEGVALN